MRTNKAHILQNARSYMAKGQMDKAISEWQKLVSESPNDGNIYNTVGDLYLKKRDRNAAIEFYRKAGEVFYEAGFVLKTIAVYKKILKLNPKQYDVYLKLGDLNAERGLTGNAIEDYLTIARHYSTEGRVKEALEIYRKIANLDPGNVDIHLKLAEMCVKEGYEADAVAEYLQVAKVCTESGKTQQAEVIYEQILKLEPTNEEARVALQLVAPSGEVSEEEVSEHKGLLASAEAAMEEGIYDQAEQILQQLVATDPSNPVYKEKLGYLFLKKDQHFMAFTQLKTAAQAYLETGEAARAVELMKEYLDVVPDQIEAHQLLASAFEQQGDLEQAIAEYVRVIDQFLAMGVMEQARSLFVKIRQWNPDHQDVKRLSPVLEGEVSDPSLSFEPLQPFLVPSQGPLHTQAEVSNVSVDEASLKDLFVEAEVYIKYGLMDKAIEQLKKIVKMDPDHMEAHVCLKEIFLTERQRSRAAEECLRLASIYKTRGNTEAYNSVLKEGRKLDPENPHLKEETDLADLLESGRMKTILSDEALEQPAVSQPVESPSSGDEPIPESIPLAEELSEPLGEPEVVVLPDQVQSVSQAHETAHAESEQPAVEAENGVEPADVHPDEQLTGSVVEAPEQGTEMPVQAIEPDETEARMAEADLYLAEGLNNEARKLYELILALDPGHSDAQARLEALTAREGQSLPSTPEPEAAQEAEPVEEIALKEELQRSISPPMLEAPGEPSTDIPAPEPTPSEELQPQAPVLEGEDEGVMDLSKILEEELQEASPPPESAGSRDEALRSVISVFHEKEASERVDDVDSETHYNLGIAYSEMSLVSEAIEEFKISAGSSERFVDSRSMLSTLFRRKGMIQEAIRPLEEALADRRCRESERRWLSYDLASLYEQVGRFEEALTLYARICNEVRTFKDVKQRIEVLCEVLGKPVEQFGIERKPIERKPIEKDEDVDTMIERIFGESSPGPTSTGRTDRTQRKSRISYL